MKVALDDWIEAQARHSAEALSRAISATGLVRHRPAFGQTVRPAPGSVLASPAIADWDPEPDYFFHWVRDGAVAMRTVVGLWLDTEDVAERRHWESLFRAMVDFSLRLGELDGAALLRTGRHRQATRRGYHRFLRPDRELARLAGDRLLGEPRFNADGGLDVQRWSRPQYDGPALRALACLAWFAAGAPQVDGLEPLLRRDLDFTRCKADRACIGPWEEPDARGHHYYVALVQLGALVHGRRWIDAEAEVRRLRRGLDRHWSEPKQAYVAVRGADDLDAAILLAVLDADLPDGRHAVSDPRIAVTLEALVALFAGLYPINRERRRAPALGRSAGDTFFGGNAWYVTTLAAAELCYRLARTAPHWAARGDAFMATVRALTPPDGMLAEQVDRVTGQPTSARDLTWSYAAFVNAARARRQADAGR